MRITCIGHSGFLVRLREADLLFDWYTGELPERDPARPLFVFASHSHPDHFRKQIFSLLPGKGEQDRRGGRITYILSDDIKKSAVPVKARGCTFFMGPGEERRFAACGGTLREADGILVRTYRSTDEGVAFLVDVLEDGHGAGESAAEGSRGAADAFVRIYHAGDLNDWHWDEENEEDRLFNEDQNRNYLAALSEIAGVTEADGRVPDAAFIPVDARLGVMYYLGMEEFVRCVGAKTLIPMHVNDDGTVAEKLRHEPFAAELKDRILGHGRPGESFEV